MAKKPTYNSYEVFNLFDAETHEWWKGLTREQFAGFVAGTYTKPYWHQFHAGVHMVQHEIHGPDGVYIYGFEENKEHN